MKLRREIGESWTPERRNRSGRLLVRNCTQKSTFSPEQQPAGGGVRVECSDRWSFVG